MTISTSPVSKLNPAQVDREITALETDLTMYVAGRSDPRPPVGSLLHGKDRAEISQNIQAAEDRIICLKATRPGQRTDDSSPSDDYLDGGPLDPLESALASAMAGVTAEDLRQACAVHGTGASFNMHIGARPLAATLTRTAGVPVDVTRSNKVAERGYSPLTVLDLLGPPISTDQASYEILVEDKPVPVAGKDATVATEALTAAAVRAEGAQLAESEITWRQQSYPIRSCGDWLPITNEQIDDVPATRQLVTGRLMRGVRQAMERQIITGDGTGQNIGGLTSYQHSTTSAATRFFSMGEVLVAKVATADDDAKKLKNIETGIFDALDLVSARSGDEATGILLNRTAMARLWKATDSDGNWRYHRDIMGRLANSPFGPDVSTTRYGLGDYADGSILAIVGDFANQADLILRSDVRVDFGLSSDDFRRLQESVRAYVRFGLAIYRPRSFCTVKVAT